MTLLAFVDSVDQDQTALSVQSDLWSTMSTFSFILQWKCTFLPMKNYYLFSKEIVKWGVILTEYNNDMSYQYCQSIKHNV